MAGSISDGTTSLSNVSLTGQLRPAQVALSSGGTLNLGTARLVSARTVAGSAVTASAGGGVVAADEAVFTVTLGSGASLLLRSGGTIWIFNSAASSIVA